MYRVKYSNRFEKNLKRCEKHGLDMQLIFEAIKLLAATGTLPAKYRPHKLVNQKVEIWECHIQPDWLMTWEQNDTELTLLFLQTGTHSDLFWRRRHFTPPISAETSFSNPRGQVPGVIKLIWKSNRSLTANSGGEAISINILKQTNNEKSKVWIAAKAVWGVNEKNVTNRELARLVGVSEQQIGKYVNHRVDPPLERLHQIAEALGLRVKDLFDPIG